MSEKPTCDAAVWDAWHYRRCDRPGKYAIRARQSDYFSGNENHPVETLMVCGVHRNQFNRRGILSVVRKESPSFLRVETRTVHRPLEEE